MIYYRLENRCNQRYYKIILSKDLFNEWMITKAWGSLNNASGRIMHVHVPSYELAMLRIVKLLKVKQKRGYHVCEPAVTA